MNKNEFINSINHEDKTMISKLYDKLAISSKSGKTVSTSEFYSPDIWGKLVTMSEKLDVNVAVNGIFEEAERRVICFHIEEKPYYPIKLMLIHNESKFSKLEHKDYLGAILSLGFKREKLGDLIVQEDRCYCAVCDDKYEYIKQNLDSIGKCPVKIEELADNEDIPKVDFESRIVVATALRLDCVTSAITGVSRSKAVDMISGSKVLLNYTQTDEKDRSVIEGSVVTIRGYGKFKICESVGTSGSGRIRLLIKKYI